MYYSNGTAACKINTEKAYVYKRRVSTVQAHRQKRRKKYAMRFIFRLILLLIVFVLGYKGLNYVADKYLDLSGVFQTEAHRAMQLQNPQLPNGCEATSLAMALTDFGVPTNKLTAYGALPQDDFSFADSGIRIGPSPETAYAGNAKTQGGFYCFAQPVVNAANTLLQNADNLSLAGEKLSATAQDITGASPQRLQEYLQSGTGVVAWVTINYEQPQYCENFVWYINGEERYIPYSNLHCVYVYGYKNGKYLINDPLTGTCAIKESQFEESYIQMGQRAVIIE